MPVLLKQIVDLTRLPSAPSTPPSACAVSPEGTGPSGLRYRHHSECVSLSVTKLRSLDQNVKAKVPTDLKSETSEESETSESVSSETFKPIPNTSMYDALLGGGPSTQPETAGQRRIIFAWWPRTSMWARARLLQRSLRALACTRPGLDLIALPDLPDARDSFQIWCDLYGLSEWQAVWYNPLLSVEEGGTSDPAVAVSDRSALVLQMVLNELTTRRIPASRRCLFHLYHSHPSAAVREDITSCGLNFMGDQDEHPLLGSLREAKGWLHADYNPSSQRPSLPAALRNGEITSPSVRVPKGYICSTVEEQHAAFRELKSQDPSVRVVLKPTDGLGCAGLVLDATEADLAPVNTKAWIKGSEYTIEEMIGAKGGPSPTVYMCGTTPIAVADQIMCGTSNHGNFVPSAAPLAMQQAMAQAGVAIGRYLNLKGQWGLDFVIDEVAQDPVVVDLNMGRPNGNLAYFLWRSIQIPPPMASFEDVHQTVVGRVGPEKETSRDYVKLLRDAGLLWLPGRTEGVLPSYFIAGQSSTIVCVSWTGREDLIALYKRLKVVDTKGTYKMDV